ncbi:hypothetical protein [Cupriavidus sp. SW-Y-13]|uniref:hypothetical protein n=1 Tax=Cupriavidus sp. SW-Y-13 TaxID=2653854 RepID=UPI001365272D|nr:hypothetical protein [Cupriavidus sp. SW-Y-13]MWL87132.1 hypothetical protein [Cupriavidus sp. SW-Y-13]
MNMPIVTEAQLRHAHQVLRIVTPFEGMSELLRRTVVAAARAMAVKVPGRMADRTAVVDLKRQAGGDFGE